jgi:predicted Fe-Mo cluster-binding NifX family protein
MIIGVPIWQSKLSPVLDSARRLLLVRVGEDGSVIDRTEAALTTEFPPKRVETMVDHGVDIVICGAVSRELLAMCVGAGITVYPWVSGSVDQAVESFLRGELPDPRLTMPGCRGRCHRPRRRHRGGRVDPHGRGRAGGPGGRGRGRGRGPADGTERGEHQEKQK